MNLWLTRYALLTACGEGVNALSSPIPWISTSRGARGALWPQLASAHCPAVSTKLERRDRACAHALLVAHRLLEGIESLGPAEEVGVVLGTALGCASVNDAYHRSMVLQGASRASPALFGYTVPSAPMGEISSNFQLRGHQLVLMAGACSGLFALAEARRALLLGRARAMLVVGSDVLSEDRIDLAFAQGNPPPIEATVALLLETEAAARAAGRGAIAALERVHVMSGDGRQGAAASTYLGASGLIELCCALERKSPDRFTFSATERGQTATGEVRLVGSSG